MGTTAEKEAYLNTTKSLLKQKINNLGGSIDDNTTFRNYANQLQNVYDNLPKTEYQEGTEINLGVTIKGKLDYENGVVGIGQSEQKTTTGKNKYDFTKDKTTYNNVEYECTNTYQFKINGTANANGTTFCNNDCVLPAGDYVFQLKVVSGNIVGSGNIEFIIGNRNGSETYKTLYVTDNSNRSGSFTLTSETTIRMRIYVRSGSVFTNAVVNLGVISGTVADHTYEKYTGGQASPNPSYPQTINSVTGEQTVTVRGKNKCNVGEMQLGTISQTDGTTISSSGDVKYSGYISVKPSTIYALSYTNGNPTIRIFKYNSDKTYLGTSVISGMTYTTDSDTHYIRVQGNVSFIDNNFQIEENSTATTYEPYITPTSYQLSLGDIEFNAIGNYKDELIYDVDEDRVYKNEKIGKKIFTGASSENWGVGSSAGYRAYMAIDGIYDYNDNQRHADKILCNSFRVSTTSDYGNCFKYNNQVYFYIGSIATDTEGWKTWLSTHNLELIYVLATPTDTEITDTTLINQVKALYNAHSLNGTTIITSNGDLPILIKCRALKGE